MSNPLIYCDKKYYLEKMTIIKGFYENKTYHIHNSFHLGDNLYNLLYFYLIKNFLEKNNIFIYYYALEEHLWQLKDFIYSPNIILKELNNKPDFSIELWGDEPLFKIAYDNEKNTYSMNKFLKIFYSNVSTIFLFNLPLRYYYYIDEDLIDIYENIQDKYKNFDILIVNSVPRSNQHDYNKNIWDNHIKYLNENFKVLTTTKVDNITCTFDDKLSVKDIGAISTKAKIIIAVNSGVVPALLNYYTLTNIKHFYVFDKFKYFSYPNFENKQSITEITVEDINKYI